MDTSKTNFDKREAVSVVERARRYLAKVPPSVSGSGGHNAAFYAACVLVVGFALERAAAVDLLAEWNLSCQPPWSDKELRHKLDQAYKALSSGRTAKPSGYLLGDKSPGDSSPSRHSRGASSSRRAAACKTSQAARDVALLAGSGRDDSNGVQANVCIPISDFMGASPAVELTTSDVACVVRNVPNDPPAGVSEASRGEATIESVYGSLEAFDAAVQESMASAGSRWVTQEMRWPNVLRVDPDCVRALPRIVDGMIVAGGDKFLVSVSISTGVEIVDGRVRAVRRIDHE